MGSVPPPLLYGARSNRLALVKCTQMIVWRLHIVLQSPPVSAAGKLLSQMIKSQRHLFRLSTAHDIHFNYAAETLCVCVFCGTALFFPRMLFVGEAEKRLGYDRFPGAVIMVGTCGHGGFVCGTDWLTLQGSLLQYYSPRRGILFSGLWMITDPCGKKNTAPSPYTSTNLLIPHNPLCSPTRTKHILLTIKVACADLSPLPMHV